jgi:hypothetical protein
MVFNATFNIISVISKQSVLLVEETGAHGTIENHQPSDKFYHIMLYRLHLAMTWVLTRNDSDNRHRLHW